MKVLALSAVSPASLGKREKLFMRLGRLRNISSIRSLHGDMPRFAVFATSFPCAAEVEGVKKRHAVHALSRRECGGGEVLLRMWGAVCPALPELWPTDAAHGQVLL